PARRHRKSVVPKQLKANAVTTAKIKARAVTTRKIKPNSVTNAKIRNNSIEGDKIVDGSVGRNELNTSTLPYSHIVFEGRGNSTVDFDSTAIAAYPLDNANYVQKRGSDDMVQGALDVAFKSTCEPPRQVQAYVLAD